MFGLIYRRFLSYVYGAYCHLFKVDISSSGNTGSMKHASRTIALCSAANFINAADRVIMPIAIIQISEKYKWDLYWQGWILSTFSFGYISSQLIVVYGYSAANKFGGKMVLASAVFLWSLSTLITPFISSSLVLLIFARILLGFGEGIGLPTVFHIYAHTVPVEERSRAFAYLIGLGSVGQTVASFICPYLSWPWMFYSFGSLGLLWVAIWLISYQDDPESPEQDLLLMQPKVMNQNVRRCEFLCHWPLWAIYLSHFAMNWSSYMVVQWLPTYLSQQLGANSEDISLTAVPYIVNSLFGVVAGHFADHLISHKKWTVLQVRRLMTTIGLLGPGVFILCFSSVNNLLLAVTFVSLSMGLLACNSSGHLSNHADVAPNHAGITFVISNTLATIPGILCGPLTAQLVMQSGNRWWPVFVLASGINFVGAIVYYSHSSASQLL